VRWGDLPNFLRQFEYDRQTPTEGGFARIRRSETNAALLAAVRQVCHGA
jgi:hypothetical protein